MLNFLDPEYTTSYLVPFMSYHFSITFTSYHIYFNASQF